MELSIRSKSETGRTRGRFNKKKRERKSCNDSSEESSKPKEGWLNKEARVHVWTKTYVVIENDSLRYYSSNTKKKVQGTIKINHVSDIKIQDGSFKHRKFVFHVITKKRVFHFQTSDEEERMDWIASLNYWKQQARGREPEEDPTDNESSEEFIKEEKKRKSYNLQKLKKKKINQKEDKKPYQIIQEKQISQEPQYPVVERTRITFDDFQLKKVIGRGRFGKILLVVKKDTGKVYAMKVIKKKKLQHEERVIVFSERDVLIKLHHPFLAELHYTFQTKSRLCLIMEYYAGGELFWHMQKGNFSEERAKFYAAQIVTVLQYMHKLDIMYRDLKPENLLLSNEGNIVLIDFGEAKEGVADTISSYTLEYYAPEIIRGDKHSKAIDWWALGTLIFDMLTGAPPFYTEDHEKMFDMIERQDPCFPSSFSPEVTDLISKLLTKDPDLRLKYCTSIRNHPWFQDIEWDKLEARKLRPPFIPNVNSPSDVRNIDTTVLEENIEDSDEGDDLEENTFSSWTYISDRQT
jgi:serine/threonine protein kinase